MSQTVIILAVVAFAAFLVSREWYFWPIVLVLVALAGWTEAKR